MRPYIDANVFIYAASSDTEVGPLARSLFHSLAERNVQCVTSELTVAEIFAPPQSQTLERENEHALLRKLIFRSSLVSLIPVSLDVLLKTIDIRRRKRMKLPDAIHAATAFASGCTHMITRDTHLVTPDIIPIPLTSEGIASLVASLA